VKVLDHARGVEVEPFGENHRTKLDDQVDHEGFTVMFLCENIRTRWGVCFFKVEFISSLMVSVSNWK
jgi:hypothetical protein